MGNWGSSELRLLSYYCLLEIFEFNLSGPPAAVPFVLLLIVCYLPSVPGISRLSEIQRLALLEPGTSIGTRIE